MLPEWCQTHSLKEFFDLLEETNIFGHNGPRKGKEMNEQTNDVAFEPVDAAPAVGGVRPDGTVEYQIVEGNEYLNDKLVKKAEVVGYAQTAEDTVH